MTEGRTRPTVELIKNAYNHIFNSGLSLSKIQDAALDVRLFPSSDTSGVPGRSIAWKLFLVPNEPLQHPSQSGPTPPLDSLHAARTGYVDLLLEKMRAPDGSYEDGFSIPGLGTSPKRNLGAAGRLGLEKNNPLSLHNENPWTQWFTSVELRKTIFQDVERTFPEIGYFRDTDVQTQLTNVLFLYAVTHPFIGYRQGMHELLAPLYYAVDYDSIPEDVNSFGDDQKIRQLCSRTWVAADAWALFEAVMRGVSQWYEWRETLQSDASPLPTHVAINASDGRIDVKPHVVPIVEACNKIQSTYLRSVDPLLWETMHAAGIEPQIYGIRWLRLLFTREFNMHDAMILWDGLFACDPTFELAQWICVAMLMRIRTHLIPSDYSTQLTYLLRYPPLPSLMAADFNGRPHHASLLLKQALALQMSPTPSTGVSVVAENRNLLNISIEVPESLLVPTAGRSRQKTGGKSASDERPGVLQGGSKAGHSRQSPSPQLGLPELIARNFLDRGDSLGINKTLMSAVSELKRNLPELAASLIRSPSTTSAAFPLVDERPPEERPPWEPRTRFEMEHDISGLRTTNKRLGESLGWIVDSLLQDDGNIEDPEGLKRIKNRKREALESLSYVRDILMGNVTNIDEDRLVGEEEFKDRKSRMATSSIERHHDFSVEVPRPAAPAPVPTVDSRLNVASPSFPHVPGNAAHNHTLAGASQPVSASRQSQSTPVLTPNSRGTQLAPWNYTRSNFSHHVHAEGASLPRLPPPTSINFRPPRALAMGPPPDQSSRRRVNHDPLGVLP